MNPIKQLGGQTAIYGLSTIVPKFLNYILVPLYCNYFVPSEYGVVTEFYAYVVFLNIILTYGMETAFFWFSKNEPKESKVYSTALLSVFSTSAFFALLTIFYSHSIANFLEYPTHPEYVWIFGLIISIDAVCAIPFVKLRKENRPFRFATLKIVNVASNVLLNLLYIIVFPYLVKQGYSFPSYIYDSSVGVGYIFISNLISSFVTLLFLYSDFRITAGLDIKLLKRMLVYAIPLLFAGLAGSINEALDRVLLKYLLPENVDSLAQLGIYGANIKIAVVLVLFIQTFRFAAEPFFFNYEKEKDSKTVFADIMKYFVLISLFILVGTLVNIDFIKYFTGSKYWEGLFVVPVLMYANLFLGIYLNLSIWYKLSGHTMMGAYIVGIGAVLTIIVNVIFVGRYGIMAAAVGRLVCYTAMALVCYWWGKKYYNIPYQTFKLLKYIALSFIVLCIFWLIPIHSVLLRLLIGNAFLALFIYFVLKRENLLDIVSKQLKFK